MALVVHQPARAEQSDLEKMANKANNPLSDVWLMVVENDTVLITGNTVPGTEISNITLIEPVMPVPLFDEKWNLIFRPIIPIISSPLDEDVGRLFRHSKAEIASSPGLLAIANDIRWLEDARRMGAGRLNLAAPRQGNGYARDELTVFCYRSFQQIGVSLLSARRQH